MTRAFDFRQRSLVQRALSSHYPVLHMPAREASPRALRLLTRFRAFAAMPENAGAKFCVAMVAGVASLSLIASPADAAFRMPPIDKGTLVLHRLRLLLCKYPLER